MNTPADRPEQGGKWTLGPWNADPSAGQDLVYDGKQIVAQVVINWPANTHLIAAAPDLYGSLKFILAFYEPGQRHLDTEAWKVAMASAQHAMRKARGETP